jgi:hypothetical protein
MNTHTKKTKDSVAEYNRLKSLIVNGRVKFRQNLARRRVHLEAQMHELEAQERALIIATSGQPVGGKNNGCLDRGLTFREAVAKVTQNGEYPMTKAGLLQELPLAYSGSVSVTVLNSRLYSNGIQRTENGLFFAKA